MLKHVHIMVIITDYNSGDFYLKRDHIAIECLVSLGNSNRSNFIMHQLKPLKQQIHCRDQQSGGLNNKYDHDNAFSMTLPSLRPNKNHLDPMMNFVFQYKHRCR